MIRSRNTYELEKDEKGNPKPFSVLLRKGDREWLDRMFPTLSTGKAIREMVIKCRRAAEAKAEQRMPSIHELDLNFKDVI